MTPRYTRVVPKLRLNRLLQDVPGYGLALEGIVAPDWRAVFSGQFKALKTG